MTQGNGPFVLFFLAVRTKYHIFAGDKMMCGEAEGLFFVAIQ